MIQKTETMEWGNKLETRTHTQSMHVVVSAADLPQLTEHLEADRRLRRPRQVVVAGDAPQHAQSVIPG